MKINSKSTIATAVLVITFGAGLFYVSQTEEEPIESDITNVETETSVEVLDFNLPNNIDHQIVERPYYTFSYNEEAEQPDWIAYTLYPLADSLRVKRKDNFRADPLVTSGSASLKDYKSSGYDRGHLAPSKALSYSKEAMDASFYLSNMSPQVPSFNRGIWKKIEAKVLDWSKESDSLYVVTGPVLDNPLGTIGDNEVAIPRAYYKTILRFQNGAISGIGFLIDNKKSSEKVTKFLTSIDSIETVTGINFYEKLDNLKQSKIEANKKLSDFIED